MRGRGSITRQAPLVFLVLALAMLFATGTLRFGPADPDHEAEAAHGPGDGHGHDSEEAADAHEEHGDEGHDCADHDDLEGLAEVRCEHGVRTIDCGSCRFEIGVVKVGEDGPAELLESATVRRRTAATPLRLTGEVRADRTRMVDVPANAAGRVAEVRVDLGQRVAKGDLLAVLHSGEVARAKADYLKALTRQEIAEQERDRQHLMSAALDALLARLERSGAMDEEFRAPEGLVGEWKAKLVGAAAKMERARRSHDREHRLNERGITPEAEHETAKEEFAAARAEYESLVEEVKLSLDLERLRAANAAKEARTERIAAEQHLRIIGLDEDAMAEVRDAVPGRDLSRLEVRAPRNGTITTLEPAPGRYVDAGETLLTVVDLTKLWIWCDLYERDLAVVSGPLAERGPLPAQVRVRSYPGESFPGALDVIDSAMDEHTRTIRARIRVENPDLRLRPGMFAEITLRVPAEGEVRVVPRTAVLTDEGRTFVFQRWRDEYWVRRPVVVRATFGDEVEIEGAVPEGATVAAGGAFMLKSDVLREKMGAG